MPPKKKAKTTSQVAVVGTPGSLTEAAALDYFGEGHEFKGVDSFADVFKAVEKGETQYGVVPIENSSSGALRSVYTLLSTHKLYIVGEHVHSDEPCLVAQKGVKLEDINRVYSHPSVLEHCTKFLDGLKNDPDRICARNTAAACAKVQKDSAAIANKRAAELNNLEILCDSVANERHLKTRYIIIATTAADLVTRVGASCPTKHSLALTVANESGGFFKMLSVFAFRNINVLKLESRPGCVAMDMFVDPAKHWEYVHFLDFEPSTDPVKNEGLMRDLEEFCITVRDFGCYTKWVEDDDKTSNFELMWK